MEVLSYIVLILLPFTGYAGGSAGKAGAAIELKPRGVDLLLMLLLWAGALASGTLLDINRWLIILIWLLAGVLAGLLMTSLRNLADAPRSTAEVATELSGNPLKRIWQRWSRFSQRMVNFQNRMTLAYLFFLLFAPVSLILKATSDPLKLKKRKVKSHWLAKKSTISSLAEYREQF